MINERNNESLDLPFDKDSSLNPDNDKPDSSIEEERENIGEKRETGIKALEDHIGVISSIIREKSSLPLKKDGSVNMKSFLEERGSLSENEIRFVKEDLRRFEEEKIKVNEESKHRIRKMLGKGAGERIIEEMVKYHNEEEENFQKFFMAVINKITSNDFYVCRTSGYDDLFNGVDIFIVDGKTKSIVCTIDLMRIIISKTGEKQLSDRKKSILNENLYSRGGKLDFFSLKKRKERNIPAFCIGFRDGVIRKFIDNFTSDLSNDEMRFFDIFLYQIEEQVKKFKKVFNKDKSLLLPDLLIQRLDVLEKDYLPKMRAKQQLIKKIIESEKIKKKQGERLKKIILKRKKY